MTKLYVPCNHVWEWKDYSCCQRKTCIKCNKILMGESRPLRKIETKPVIHKPDFSVKSYNPIIHRPERLVMPEMNRAEVRNYPATGRGTFRGNLRGMNRGMGGSGYVAAAPACVDPDCATFAGLICQNFETATTGYDNSEDWVETIDGGTVEAAYTTVHLRGAQSLSVTSAGAVNQARFAQGDQAELYIHFLFQTDAIPTTTSRIILKGQDSASSTLFNVWILGTDLGTAGQLAGTAGAGVAITTDTLSASTTYHIWVHYLQGGGGAGLITVEFTAATTRAPVGSGSKFATAAHSVNTACNRIVAYNTVSGPNNIYDQILAKTTAIGTVCE